MVLSRSAENRHRTARLRRRPDRDEAEGETVIRAVVHARLLGLRLLTLDARVSVVPLGATTHARWGHDANLYNHAPRDGWALPATPSARSNARDPAPRLADAVQLLAQGADTLQAVRRFRA